MKRSSGRILTTHAGSLVRPQPIMEVLRDEAYNRPIDAAALARELRGVVAGVVARQKEAGVDVPSDGEFGKVGWNIYVLERFTGLSPAEPTREYRFRGLDRSAFPEFYAGYDRQQYTMWLPESMNAVPELIRWDCTGPVAYRGEDAVRRDIDNFKAALAAAGFDEGFLPVAAPGSVEASHRNRYYATSEEYLQALAEALKPEYRAIVDAGLILQVDDAFMPSLWDLVYFDHSMEEFLAFSELRIEALNPALEGIDPERVRYHICWGSWNAPHTGDVPLRDVVHLMLKVKAAAYSIEAANPRHEHEFRVWEDVALPEGKVLIPGVVTHSTNVVEHPELVAMRIESFTRLVGRENVIAGTDCGFAQHWNLIRTHESVQWAKLRALAEGAAIASSRLWQRA